MVIVPDLLSHYLEIAADSPAIGPPFTVRFSFFRKFTKEGGFIALNNCDCAYIRNVVHLCTRGCVGVLIGEFVGLQERGY